MSARTVALRAAPPRTQGAATLHAKVRLTIDGEPLELEITLPAVPVRLAELAPVLHGLADLMASIGSERAQRDGHSVSCRKGCGACCRQPVPITETEASVLAELVHALPEPRQSELRVRFARALERLEPSGLLGPLRHPAELDRAGLSAVGRAYFALGVACPFLERESCSIHAERPLACREFLVTSPPSACEAPSEGTVRSVTLPTHVLRAGQALDARGGSAGWTTLVLALERLEPRDPVERPGLEWLRDLFAEMGTVKGELPPIGLLAVAGR